MNSDQPSPRILPAAARRKSSSEPEGGRFGAFSGVFTPSILTILGVVMYLRFGWVVGNVGLGGALLIVLLAHAISLITGMSVSSIATNRKVGPGGAYFMISRSLGGPAGAAIGIPLFFAQALSVTFYIVGFAEAVQRVMPAWDPRWIGTATCIGLTLLTMKSADLAIKAQYFVMAIIGLSLLSFFFTGPGAEPQSSIVWWNPDGAGLPKVFAVFFPAVTGIMAGLSMSGDLRDPRRDLPRGTLAAILVGLAIYLVFPIWLALNADTESLITELDIVWRISSFSLLISLGVWAATLSSAIGSILTAPRTLQAIAADGLAPRFFAHGAGPTREPRRGLLFTFALAQIGVLLGSLDLIASVLTMFFLATYGVTNLACGLERWADSPSFRPSISIPWWLSLLCAAACFYVMSIIDVFAMIVALVICGSIYAFAQRRVLDTTYGDARHGIWAALTVSALHRLRRSEFHAINWRPNLIVFGGVLEKRNHLAELGTAIAQRRGLVTLFHLLEGRVADKADERVERLQELRNQVGKDYPNVFCRVDIVPDLYAGMVNASQSYGVGTLEANTVMMGWLQKVERAEPYFQALRDMVALGRSLLLVRYDLEHGYGANRRIDIWWGGLENNGAMMLLLAFLLTSQDRWRHSQVRLLTIVERKTRVRDVAESLSSILQRGRLVVEPLVLLREGRRTDEIMRQSSAETDLAMIGLRLPKAGEDSGEYLASYHGILDALPTTILVASSGRFEGTQLILDDEPTKGDSQARDSSTDVLGTASASKPPQTITGSRG